jgi:CelD/BcsL family acetyltransferase involved in cellulose biosynthesis
MAQLTLIHLRSVAALAERAGQWNALWQRAEVTIPTVQAECLLQWLRRFDRKQTFHALAVEQGSQLVAALPLVGRRLGKVMPVGALAGNVWTPAGELLLDPAVDVPAALDCLVRGLARLPWQLLWFDLTVLDAPRWRQFAAACERAGLATAAHERYRIPRIDTTTDWQAYRESWSGNHRRNMNRHRRELAAEHGGVSLKLVTPFADDPLRPLLRRGFELEDRSWKGAAKTSTFHTDGMFEYYCRQAELLAERGQLQLAGLQIGERPIAFHYAWLAKGVYHPFKSGYDPDFREYGPGQLLIHDLLEYMFAMPECLALDCVGPATAATDKWQPEHYRLGRLVVAPRRLLSRSLMYAYQHIWPVVRKWRASRVGRAPL